MSVSTKLQTNFNFEPDELFKTLVHQGEKMVARSAEFPTLRFGTAYKAITGVEIDKMEDGYEVSVPIMASAADYRLYALVIDTIAKITGCTMCEPEDEEKPIAVPVSESYNEDWIESRRESALMAIKSIVYNTGTVLIADGLFAPVCIGGKLLDFLDIKPESVYSKELMDNLEEQLTILQWNLSQKEDTSTHIRMKAPNAAEEDDFLSVSAIFIKDGKVAPFDYISYADVFAIFDNDTHENALIPFSELWKILPEGFSLLDEYQFMRDEEFTTKMAHEMMERARKFQPKSLHKLPTYPGHGEEDGQNTFILMWNPDISSVSLDDHKKSIPHMVFAYFNWSVREYEKASIGDKFYLVRCGNGRTGIVMSGIFDSQPYESGDWRGKGRQTFYMDMRPNVILDPDTAPMITTDELEKAIPSFNWRKGASGRMLSAEEAKALEKLWSEFIADHKEASDNKTLYITELLCGKEVLKIR